MNWSYLNRKDDAGNVLRVGDTGKVKLYLPHAKDGSKDRDIGDLTLLGLRPEDGVLYTKKLSEAQHKFFTTGAWGFCWMLVEQLPPNSVIRLTSGKASYETNPGAMRTSGNFLHYKEKGYELQLMVPFTTFSVTALGRQATSRV